MRAENRLGELGGELLAVVGRAGLHEHRLALRRTRHVERAAHRIVFSLVIEVMHLVRLEEQPAVLVAHERIVVPAIPQALDHFGEFVRALIAFVVRKRFGAVEIERLGHLARGDEIPARNARR